VVKDVMKQYSGEIDVVEICTDDLAEVAEDAGVVSIPTIQFYFGGKPLETHSIVGCVAKTVLANAVEKVLEDVAQIRKKQAP
jgi:thioredoxin 1